MPLLSALALVFSSLVQYTELLVVNPHQIQVVSRSQYILFYKMEHGLEMVSRHVAWASFVELIFKARTVLPAPAGFTRADLQSHRVRAEGSEVRDDRRHYTIQTNSHLKNGLWVY